MTAARHGLTTIILEAAPQARWKPGETLAPECNPILKKLDLWELLAARPDIARSSAGVRSLWGSDEVFFRDGFRERFGPGWIIDRAAFETFLSERAVDAGAAWSWGTSVRSVERVGKEWQIETPDLSDGRIRARILIDATGRPARFARRLGARRVSYRSQIARVIGWRATVEDTGWTNVESAPDSWWYTVRDPGGTQILAWLPGDGTAGRSRDKMRRALAATKLIREIVGPPPWHAPLHETSLNAESAALDKHASDGWLAVGDAAAAFDPISSQGLSHALASGSTAAQAAADFLHGRPEALRAYSSDIAAAYEFYLRGLSEHYRSEARWPERKFWQKRQAGAISS